MDQEDLWALIVYAPILFTSLVLALRGWKRLSIAMMAFILTIYITISILLAGSCQNSVLFDMDPTNDDRDCRLVSYLNPVKHLANWNFMIGE
jgi:cell division protein FtsW (lipid II flippase)